MLCDFILTNPPLFLCNPVTSRTIILPTPNFPPDRSSVESVTIFDRYVLFRYFHVFAVLFLSAVGLFAVIDGFTNLDEFQSATQSSGSIAMLALMAKHYLYQSAMLLDLAGPTIIVLSAMCSLVLLLRHGEIHPVLAAGVPTYRMTFPLIVGSVLVCGLLVVNQEFLLPRIAHHLQGRYGDVASDAQSVQPQYDPQWWIFVSAKEAYADEKRLHRPEFQLPAPTLADDYVSITAEDAIYLPATRTESAGWLLKNVDNTLTDIPLTEQGRKIIVPQPNSNNVFIACVLTFDQLSKQASNYRLISTPDIFQRLKHPSGSSISRQALLIQLHTRLTRPLLILVGVICVIPLIIRKERMSNLQQVTNIAICMAVLGIIFGLTTASHYLGQSGVLKPVQAVWFPLICSGSFAGWLTGSVRT